MKKQFFIAGCCLVLAILLLKAGSGDWRVYRGDEVPYRRVAVDNSPVKVQAFDPDAIVATPSALAQSQEEKEEISQDVADVIKKSIYSVTNQYALRTLLDQFNNTGVNPTWSSEGKVSDRSSELHEAEAKIVNSPDNYADGYGTRLGKAAKAQEKLFTETVAIKDALRIGICFSGGGYRAMTLSLGYALALAKMGIWDSASYISTLSGSTWFLSTLMNVAELNKGAGSLVTLEKVVAHFTNKIKSDTFALAKTNAVSAAMKNFTEKDSFLSFLNNSLWPKFVFQQPFRSVDIYGGLLAETLLSGLSKEPQNRRLSQELSIIQSGDWPFPIRTAVSMVKEDTDYKYHWFEFNPIEVRDVETDLAIPTFSFGRAYSGGTSVNWAPEKKVSSLDKAALREYGPEERLGYLMGIWGSAFTVNLKDIKTLMGDEVEDGTIADTTKEKFVRSLLESLEKDAAIGTSRISPAQVNNPFKGCGANKCPQAVSSWLSEKEYLTFVDAGIACNLPLPPLFNDHRQLDVIIIGDSSGDIDARGGTPNVLSIFFAYIKAKDGLVYERRDDRKNNTLSVWEVKANSKAPLIIYVNFVNNKELMDEAKNDRNLKALIDTYNLGNFDYAQALKGYADTFNFDYKLEQFNQLRGIAEFNMRANGKVIYNVLRERFDKKRPLKEEEEEMIFGEF